VCLGLYLGNLDCILQLLTNIQRQTIDSPEASRHRPQTQPSEPILIQSYGIYFADFLNTPLSRVVYAFPLFKLLQLLKFDTRCCDAA
jgi:hypothetical protein